MDPGARPGLDPGFAGVTIQETLYEIIFLNIGNSDLFQVSLFEFRIS
jgi:hypothetical protein